MDILFVVITLMTVVMEKVFGTSSSLLKLKDFLNVINKIF